MTANDYMRVYRETWGLTQAKPGEMLKGVSRQRISDIENGRTIKNWISSEPNMVEYAVTILEITSILPRPRKNSEKSLPIRIIPAPPNESRKRNDS